MSTEIEFFFIGWCKETRTGKKADKVWTAFEVNGKLYAGWGARDKSIRFKQHMSRSELRRVITSKQKEYNEVDTFQLFSIFPTYKDDVEKKLSFDLLANKIM